MLLKEQVVDVEPVVDPEEEELVLVVETFALVDDELVVEAFALVDDAAVDDEALDDGQSEG